MEHKNVPSPFATACVWGKYHNCALFHHCSVPPNKGILIFFFNAVPIPVIASAPLSPSTCVHLKRFLALKNFFRIETKQNTCKPTNSFWLYHLWFFCLTVMLFFLSSVTFNLFIPPVSPVSVVVFFARKCSLHSIKPFSYLNTPLHLTISLPEVSVDVFRK